MNSEFWSTTVRSILLSVLSSGAAAAYISSDQAVAIATGVAALVTAAYGWYAHYGMRKVPETAVVTATAPTVADAKALSTVGK